MRVLAVDNGKLCALSPNRSLYAIVKKGLVVVFIDYVRRTCQLKGETATTPNDVVPPVSNGDVVPPACRNDSVISKYTALDEIHELQWSPDSTLVALLLARRGIIEIVSVYGKICVARVDAGVVGLRAMHWHPSSRAVYWVGLLHAHVFSLLDSQLMQLPGGVKYSAQLAGLRLTVPSQGQRNASPLRSRSGGRKVGSDDRSGGSLWPGKPVSEAALIRFSLCHRFLFYVTPKLLHSPLSAVHAEKDSVHSASSEDALQSQAAIEQTNADSKCFQRRSEWLVVLSATTHEGLHAFSIAKFVPCVSDCIPLQGGIALVDYAQGSVALTTYDGTRLLHYEPTGVRNVTASKCGNVLLIVFGRACRAVIASKKRVVALRRIFFDSDVVLPFKMGELTVMEEPSSPEKSFVEFLQLSGGDKRNSSDVACLGKYDGWAAAGDDKELGAAGLAAISASGKLAAVILPLWPSTVIVIDVVQQRVLSVLCHHANAVGLYWAPSPHSKYWQFQRRHYMQPLRHGRDDGTGKVAQGGSASCGDGSRSTASTFVGQDEPLLITTDNCESKVFVWLSDRAMCFAAAGQGCPVSAGGALYMCPRKVDALSHNASGALRLRVNRGMFGDEAEGVVLVDDVQETAVMVTLDGETGEI
ncbi:hypothetical protein, conserved [Trypanosoma brucei gambiense DAL972]|uniref:Uncharacterized protein n=1 Tax=Trypanosoma brucei gambiense (strain MHOM/CI/86/DAL972) TaxID=679716 RepID=D0A6Q5_TRYB9|nr:hypothetical protein, conserved [Trypanosoma brucei gambiense DAL972]CBH17356.1 hypothetical protein, conserved [Trypanosoma brucei gambiense DAL972]|eukprot:XP_011779620.1 hypothetical protein, conserved [Trypanosoma brucei gambiense DAL972]